MTPRNVSYIAACLAAGATLAAAFDGSVAALYVAAPLWAGSVLAAIVFAVLHWRAGRRSRQDARKLQADLARKLSEPWQPVILPPETTPDLGTLTDCVWCRDTGQRALARDCVCTTPCKYIAWCQAYVRRATA